MKKVKHRRKKLTPLAKAMRQLTIMEGRAAQFAGELTAANANLNAERDSHKQTQISLDQFRKLRDDDRKFYEQDTERRRRDEQEAERQRTLDAVRKQVDDKDKQLQVACNERDRMYDIIKRFTSLSVNSLNHVVSAVTSDSSPTELRRPT